MNIHEGKGLIQVNLTMSNLHISSTRHMLKWSSIPEHFPYIALYFKPVYVELCYHEISVILKWFFIPENLVFRFFTTTCVEVKFVLVKKWNNMNVKQSY